MSYEPDSHYDDDAPLTDELSRVEYTLKEALIDDLILIQVKRATGNEPTDSTVRNYVNHARALRKIGKGRPQEYKNLIDFAVYDDNVKARVEWDDHKTVYEVVTEMHDPDTERPRRLGSTA